MRAAIIIAAVAVAGCTTPGYTRKTAKVTGNEVSVTVNNVWSANQAFPLADEHCKKFGKAARLTNSGKYAFTFDCVRP